MLNVRLSRYSDGCLVRGALAAGMGLSLLHGGCSNGPLPEVAALELPTGAAVGRESDRAEIRSLLREQPERLAQVEGAYILHDDRLRQRPDGNYDLTIFKKEGPTTVVTYGESFALAETARSLRVAPMKENRLAIYRQLLASIDPETRRSTNLPEPSAAQGLSAEVLSELIVRITHDSQLRYTARATVSTESFSGTCATEEGASPRGDGAARCSHDPSGLFARFPFAMRDHQTCVKDQGSRGTCVAFAIAGAIESSAAMLHGRATNLSEQDFYRYSISSLRLGDYGDGLPTGEAAAAGRSYTFAWEAEWAYNPSPFRRDLGSSYLDSCSGYTGLFCSDTSHQSNYSCSAFGCGYVDSATKTSGFTVDAAFEIGTDTFGRGVARTYLSHAIAPTVLSFHVTPSFDNARGGIVAYRRGEGNRGSHAMQLVGFVWNYELPVGIPPAAGAGYFIGRNSWGCGFGDGGYVYLPDNFVAEYGHSMLAVLGN